MLSLLVFDDWLAADRLAAVQQLVEAHFRTRAAAGEQPIFSWYSPRQRRHVSRVSREQRAVAEAYIDDLVSRLAPLLGLGAAEPAEGYEWWSNFGNTLDWHRDKDETLFTRERELRMPIWSTVFYSEVAIRGRGGELSLLCGDARPYQPDLTATETPHPRDTIAPRTNRLVVFRTGLLHRIDPFHGVRSSLAMNVWDATPQGIDCIEAAHSHPL